MARLEKEVESMKARLPPSSEQGRPWWEEHVGVFKDDEAFQEVQKIIQEERRKDYERTIRRIDREEAREKAQKEKAIQGRKKPKPARAKK